MFPLLNDDFMLRTVFKLTAIVKIPEYKIILEEHCLFHKVPIQIPRNEIFKML